MTTDLIAAARAMIEPLTGYTTEPWEAVIYDDYSFIVVSPSGYDGDFKPSDARLIAAAPDLRDMVATLADALEAERSKVAAAYEAAALFSESQRREGDSFYNDGWCACATVVAGGIRNITPADAQATLDNLLAEARLEGWRAGREAAADEAQSCTHDPYVVRAIRAMPEPKEVSE